MKTTKYRALVLMAAWPFIVLGIKAVNAAKPTRPEYALQSDLETLVLGFSVGF